MALAGSKPLTNTRQELFVQGILKGLPANRAYVAAGYADKTADQASSRLLSSVKVAERLDYLRTKVADKVVAGAVWTKERVIARLEQNIELAEQLEMPQAINTSLNMIGKEIGMFADVSKIHAKMELVGKHPSEMSLEELQRAADILPEEASPEPPKELTQ